MKTHIGVKETPYGVTADLCGGPGFSNALVTPESP